MPAVATRNDTAPTAIVASRSDRSSALIAPWTGSAAPASTASVSQPPRARTPPAGAPRSAWARTISAAPTSTATPPMISRRAQWLGVHPEPAEAVEHQRGEHLSRDPEADREHRSEAREQQDAGGDVDGAAEPADQMPRLGPVEPAERVERARDRRRREQEGRADAELERRRAERAPGRRAELDVGGRLDRQQGADEEQEGNRERLHVGLSLVSGRSVRFTIARPDAASG